MDSLSILNSLISTFHRETIIIDSLILSQKEWFSLCSIIESKHICQDQFTLSLLYRGSEHGFTAETFHSLCDGKANTLTLVQSEHGNVFGGFTTIPWSSNTGWHTDPEAFVFLLRSHSNMSEDMHSEFHPMVYDINDRWIFTAVYHEKDWCSVFGYCGNAICIHDHCDQNQDSFSVHCETYATPKTLAGKPQFQVIEYEVFQIHV
eukprot:433727_1